MTQFEMTIYIILICLALALLSYYSIKKIIQADKETWKRLKGKKGVEPKNLTPKELKWLKRQKPKYLEYLEKLIEKENQE